jgi:hypothetical protein
MIKNKINFGGFPKIIKIDNELKVKIEFNEKINNNNNNYYNKYNNNMNFKNILDLKKIKK